MGIVLGYSSILLPYIKFLSLWVSCGQCGFAIAGVAPVMGLRHIVPPQNSVVPIPLVAQANCLYRSMHYDEVQSALISLLPHDAVKTVARRLDYFAGCWLVLFL